MMKFKQIAITLYSLMLVVLFNACETDVATHDNPDNHQAIPENFSQEKAYPDDISREIVKINWRGKTVEVEKIDNNYIFQGDIIASPTKEKMALRGTGRTEGRWPNNTVFYEIDESLPNQDRVLDAIAHWTDNTNLRFVERTDENDYVLFIPGLGCASNVGYLGRFQIITLSEDCTTGNTIHEIGHTVGLWHEQSRADRDEFMIVNFENILPGRENNFLTYEQEGADGDEYSAMDFGSVMMYPSFAFSINNTSPTITRLDGSVFNIQRNGLSDLDIEGINAMYPPIIRTKTLVPFYEFYNRTEKNHYYSTNKEGLNELDRNKGFSCKVFTVEKSGTVPLHKYYNERKKDHLYTTDFSEFGMGKRGYKYVEISCYVYDFNKKGTIPLHGYYNAKRQDHRYTTNFALLRDGKNGYTYQGISCYVLPKKKI